MKVLVILALVATVVQGLPKQKLWIAEPTDRIVGGEPAEPNEIKYQVSIHSFGSHFCGGSILNENHVVTAAHCMGLPAGLYTIFAGEYNLVESDGTEQSIQASEVFIHEGYGNGDGTNANDIAILRLSSPLVFTDAVQPIALPEAGHISTGTVQTSGWGTLESDGPSPDVLHKVQMPIVDDTACEETYEAGSRYTVNGQIQICAGLLGEGGKDSCQGDSGGPLVAYDDGEYLAGIVSWGKGCGLPEFPGVYTEVAQYIDWINAIIN